MNAKKILVPIGTYTKDLKSVRYALALADRLQAQIYILQQNSVTHDETPQSLWLDEALWELINRARQNGVVLSHYTVNENFKEEIVRLAGTEHIDLLVFGADEAGAERLLLQVKALVPSQIIQVREKDDLNHLLEGK